MWESNMTQSRQETSPNKPTRQSTTLLQSIFTGSVAGAAETLLGHPAWSIKTRIQCGDPFTLNPVILYRGFPVNVASMAPITAVQVSMYHCLQQLFMRDTDAATNHQRITCAFVAGISSALISCPTEMVMTYQKTHGVSFYAGGYSIVQHGGAGKMMTGLVATGLREGIFTAAFLGVRPVWKNKMTAAGCNEKLATVAAGISAGTVAAVVSQSIDTIKTEQQAAPLEQPVNLKQAVVKIYSGQGVAGFFKGGLARGVRVMVGVTVMGYVSDKLNETFTGLRT